MNTQKLDLNEEKKNKKEGMDGATVAMSAAGVAAAGVVGATLLNDDTDTPVVEDPANTGGTTETQQEDPAQQAQTEEPAQPAQPAQNQGQQANANEPTPLAPDQSGTSGGQTASTPASTGGTTASTDTETTIEVVPEDPAEAEALAIAEHLVGEDEIDVNDIDAPTLAIVDTDIIYAEDGSEIPVAMVSVPGDSDPYLLADVDGDHVYDFVVDSNGDIVDYVQGGLNIDDAEIAVSGDAGYLAANEDSIEILNEEDIMDDVLVLDDGYETHLETVDIVPEEEIASTDFTDEQDPLDILDDSDVMDDILSDISYDAPDEV